jgi:hypothetical protein
MECGVYFRTGDSQTIKWGGSVEEETCSKYKTKTRKTRKRSSREESMMRRRRRE